MLNMNKAKILPKYDGVSKAKILPKRDGFDINYYYEFIWDKYAIKAKLKKRVILCS